jgi:hypothetical protein
MCGVRAARSRPGGGCARAERAAWLCVVPRSRAGVACSWGKPLASGLLPIRSEEGFDAASRGDARSRFACYYYEWAGVSR